MSVGRVLLADDEFEGGDKTHQPGLAGVQSLRQVMDASGDALQPVHCLPAESVGLVPSVHSQVPEQFEVDRQERDLLTDVVVQLAGDTRTLDVLFTEQPPAQIADPFVARPQLGLTSARVIFRLSSSRGLHEQSRDQGCLGQQKHYRDDDVGRVAPPDAELSKPDERTGRDAPVDANAGAGASHLTDVHRWDINVVGVLSVQHAGCQRADRLNLGLLVEKATDDACPWPSHPAVGGWVGDVAT